MDLGGNPARRIEMVAIELLQAAVGDRGHVVNTGEGTSGGPDFRIDYVDGRVGVGEVTWHDDPAYRGMWNELLRREHLLELPADIGQWSVHLQTGARVRQAYRRTPGLLERFAASQSDVPTIGMTLQPTWPIGPLADEARDIGIESFYRYSMASPALALMQPVSTGGVLSDEPNIIVDWLEGVVRDRRYTDLTEKLRHIDADELHIFVVTGSAARYDVDHLFRALDQALPTRDPDLPPWLTHAWVMSMWGEPSRHFGRWERGRGWSTETSPVQS